MDNAIEVSRVKRMDSIHEGQGQFLNIALEIEVLPIKSFQCKEWVLKIHYAHRKPRIQFAFGLFYNKILEGVVTYGYPATPFVARGICGEDYEEKVLELNRLVISENMPKNSASFLVGKSLKMLPDYCKIVVSYADTSQGHLGKVYQATNFIYTGLTIPMKEWRIKGSNLHSQNACKKADLISRKNSPLFEQIEREKKHRYLMFRGSAKEKKDLLKNLKYPIKKYPKGESKRYSVGELDGKQSILWGN